MATKFIDQLGISHIFTKIKTLLSGKANDDLSNVDASTGRAKLGLNDAIVDLSVSGKVITYKQADGGTGTITTQDTNTTYTAMTASEATTGTATTARSISAKVLNDKINEVVTAKAYTHPSTHPASMITGLSTVATSGSYNDLSNKPTIPTIPSSLPANGGNADTVGGFTVGTNVPADAKFTDTVYTLPNATSSTLGGVKVGTNISVSSGTISVANGSTSAKGVVQLTNSTSSTSTTTAATPNSVKSAYDLANSKQSPATTLSGYGITDAYTKTEVDAKVSGLVDSAPETLNTLNELAAALGDDPNFATTIATQIGTKANSADLAKVATSGKYSDLSGTPSSLPANGGNAATVGGFTVGVSVPSNAKFTDTTYSAATTSAAGLMSASDKAKLDGIASGANAYSLPTASSSTLGGVKTTSTVTSTSGLTACPIISGVPYYKDTNNTYTLSSFGVTATAAELNILDGVTATATELNYVDGVTSNIQTQLNGKLSTSGTAAKATADASGNTITSTYETKANAITGLSVDGKVITYTKGDGSTGTITTQDTNTTYTQEKLGQGYGTCATAEATVAKVVTLSNYTLTKGGVVVVKFTYGVPASATMNINSKGAKSIYYQGKAIVDGVICAGEVATFIYDGSYYHLLAVDRNRFYSSLVPYGTAITASESATKDLNTVEFMKVGNYYCSANAQAKYVTNLPESGTAFMMQVYSPLSQTVDNENGTWVYRIRKLTHYQGTEYVQYSYTNGTGGNWTYGPWYKTISSKNTASSSALGVVKVGSNISVSSGTISLTKANVTSALGYTPVTQSELATAATTAEIDAILV